MLDFAFGFEVSYVHDYFANVWWFIRFTILPVSVFHVMLGCARLEKLFAWVGLYYGVYIALSSVCPQTAVAVAAIIAMLKEGSFLTAVCSA